MLNGPKTLVQAITFNHELCAIAADAQSGKLVVASKKHVWVLEPVTEGWTRIWWERVLLLKREDEGDEAQCLSWGNEGELLVGGTRMLTLFSTLPSSRSASPRASAIDGEMTEERKPLWSMPVSSHLRQAAFSPRSGLIATCSRYDRLVKIWRRLSFEEGLFDHTYLPHPGAITHLEWRPLDEHAEERRGSGISRRHDEDPEVLYTMANDGVLRIWKTAGIHDLDILVLHTSIDLVAAIPESPSISGNEKSLISKPARFAVMLPADQFSAAVNAAIGIPQSGKVNHSKELLKEMLSKDMDIIVAFDGQGRMSAWGLQSIGHKRRPETPTTVQPFHVAHAEGLDMRLPPQTPAISTAWFQDDQFHLLSHTLFGTGTISWWQGDVESFFSPAATGAQLLSSQCSWRGVDVAEWGVASRKADIDPRHHPLPSDEDEVLHAVSVSMPFDPKQSCVVSVSKSGHITCTLSSRSSSSTVGSEIVASFETGVQEASVFDASTEFAGLVSQDLVLLIVDLTDGYIEHREQLGDGITDLQIFTPTSRHNFLAIGYNTTVDVLAQGRYDDHGSVWQRVKSISISGLGLSIYDLAWKSDGSLGVAAGNALFITSPDVDPNQLPEPLQAIGGVNSGNAMSLLELTQNWKTPLPIWHPSVLSDLLFHGYAHFVVYLLKQLANKLKFYSAGDFLSPTLGDSVDGIVLESYEHDDWLDDETASELHEQLKEKELPRISRAEQCHLGLVIQAITFLRTHVKGLDTNALRYLFTWKLQILEHDAKAAPLNATSRPNDPHSIKHFEFVPEMHWREITFAYHSTTQQPLLDILILHHDNKLTWHIARLLGIMSWIREKEALETVFEQLAQTAYRADQPPDPANASIYFLALRKKPTLVALWRIATWHKEQRTTMNFLKRDFSLPDAKTAAKKNAYALMGKRRFHYSAAFFLLADDPASACNVLAGQCEDLAFAIAVARLYCGDGSPALSKLVVDRVLPQAKTDGNRWLTSWCHSIFGEAIEAAGALVRPLQGVRSWIQDDPSTLLLYKQLRKTPSEFEYDAILRAARLLRRKGEWILALDLVRKWEFKPASAIASSTQETSTHGLTNGFHLDLPDRTMDIAPPAAPAETPSLLDSFTEPKPTQPTNEKAAREAKAAELLAKMKAKKNAANTTPAEPVTEKKREPTQFKEPDANSLLDTFGF